MKFLTTFAISTFLVAMLFHVYVVISLAILSSRIEKYGPGLVKKIGGGLPRIDYADPRIPKNLRENFRRLKVNWGIGMVLFLSPMAAYMIARKLF
jgi:hypothetical protein